jgi:hypothetical protein
MKDQLIPIEAQEQVALFEWAQLQSGKYPELALMFAIPNGGSRHIVEAVHLKAQGVKAGVPDIFLPVARLGYHGLFIELKRSKGGVVSIDQKLMISALRDQSYAVEVCKGWEAAANVIKVYLGAA